MKPITYLYMVLRLRMCVTIPALTFKLPCLDSFHLLPEIGVLGNVTGRDRLEQVGVDGG